jgi:hypothetical protein
LRFGRRWRRRTRAFNVADELVPSSIFTTHVAFLSLPNAIPLKIFQRTSICGRGAFSAGQRAGPVDHRGVVGLVRRSSGPAAGVGRNRWRQRNGTICTTTDPLLQIVGGSPTDVMLIDERGAVTSSEHAAIDGLPGADDCDARAALLAAGANVAAFGIGRDEKCVGRDAVAAQFRTDSENLESRSVGVLRNDVTVIGGMAQMPSDRSLAFRVAVADATAVAGLSALLADGAARRALCTDNWRARQ